MSGFHRFSRTDLAVVAVVILTISPSVPADDVDVIRLGRKADTRAARGMLERWTYNGATDKQKKDVIPLLCHPDKEVRVLAAECFADARWLWKHVFALIGTEGSDNPQLAEVIVDGAIEEPELFMDYARDAPAEHGRMIRYVFDGMGRIAEDRVLKSLDPSRLVRFLSTDAARRVMPRLIKRAARDQMFRHRISIAVAMLLDDDDERVRMIVKAIEWMPRHVDPFVLSYLGGLGSRARGAVALLRKCATADDLTALYAAVALHRIEGEPKYLPVVARIVARPDSEYHALSHHGSQLIELGPRARRLFGVLLGSARIGDGWKKGRLAFAHAVGVDPAVLPRMRQWLRSGDAVARLRALAVLAELGSPPAAVPDVRALLRTGDGRIRTAAARMLVRAATGPGAGSAGHLDRLAAALPKADDELACGIVEALGDERDTIRVLALLSVAARRENAGLRVAVLKAYARIGGAAATDALPHVRAALNSSSSALQIQAVRTAAAFGARSQDVVAPLQKLADTPSELGIGAAWALWRIRDDPVFLAAIVNRMRTPALRLVALRKLAVIGRPAARHVAEVRRRLRDLNGVVRVHAAFALYRITGKARSAALAIGAELRPHAGSELGTLAARQDAALTLLGMMGADAAPAMPEILWLSRFNGATNEQRARARALLQKKR